MTTISSHAKACLAMFRRTTDVLNEDRYQDAHAGIRNKLDWEKRRFKLWCANLGALKVGPGSLDERLRDAGTMHSAILSHLRRLARLLRSGCDFSIAECLTQARINATSEDDGYYSEETWSESDSDDDNIPEETTQSKLGILAKTLQFIMEELFVLSFRIRRSIKQPYRDSRIKTFREFDADSGVDKFEAYAKADTAHVEASLLQMRADVLGTEEGNNRCTLRAEDTFLVDRIVATMKMRRKTIRYRERHAAKLASMDEEFSDGQEAVEVDGDHIVSSVPVLRTSSGRYLSYAQSIRTGTFPSGTVATEFFDSQQEEIDTQSSYSYASVATEALASGISFPQAPSAAFTDGEFVCPFCSIVIASQHGKGKAWKLHVLRDLRPYFCTYKLCRDGDLLYDSKTDWLEHERTSHRRAWRCPDHTSLAFESESAYDQHIVSEHKQSATEQQIDRLSRLAECTLKDTRSQCPFCLTLDVDAQALGDHMAMHMQRFAMFSAAFANPSEAPEDESNTTCAVPITADQDGLANPAYDELSLHETVGSDVGDQEPAQASTRIDMPLELSRKGLAQHIKNLNPQGSPQLLEKLVNEQMKRYQRLVKLRSDHETAAQMRKCPNGDLCRFENRFAHQILTPKTGIKSEAIPPKNIRVIAHGHAITSPPRTTPSTADSIASFPEGIPLPPVPQLPARFECPLCFKVKDFQKSSDWTKHVHEDLQPFTCTFLECAEPRSFKRKADWVIHENEGHRHLEQWKCTTCSHVSHRKDNFVQHLVREHKIPEPKVRSGRIASSRSGDTLNLTPDQIWDLVDNCRSASEKEAGQEPCRFCGERSSNYKKLAVHLSQHLLQLSLPILDAIGQETGNENSSIETNWDLKPDNILVQEGPETGKSLWALTDLRPAQHELEENDAGSMESDAQSQNDGREQAKSGSPGADVAERGARYYYCPHDDCQYRSKRKADLHRHVNNKHPATPPFDCLFTGCHRTGAKGFHQEYHRTEHMRKIHDMEIKTDYKTSKGASEQSIPGSSRAVNPGLKRSASVSRIE